MMMWYRGNSIVSTLLIVGLLVATSFVMVPSTVNATIESGPDDRGIYIYTENLDSRSIYVGDRGVTFYIRMINSASDEYDDDDPIRNCNLSIDDIVRDVDGNTVVTPISNWDTQEVNANASLPTHPSTTGGPSTPSQDSCSTSSRMPRRWSTTSR
jgi:hypothetical protein